MAILEKLVAIMETLPIFEHVMINFVQHGLLGEVTVIVQLHVEVDCKQEREVVYTGMLETSDAQELRVTTDLVIQRHVHRGLHGVNIQFAL